MGSIKVKINNKEIKLPVIKGSENECGIDITQLRKETGYITLDPGYANTGSCKSNITFPNTAYILCRLLRGTPDLIIDFQTWDSPIRSKNDFCLLSFAIVPKLIN